MDVFRRAYDLRMPIAHRLELSQKLALLDLLNVSCLSHCAMNHLDCCLEMFFKMIFTQRFHICLVPFLFRER